MASASLPDKTSQKLLSYNILVTSLSEKRQPRGWMIGSQNFMSSPGLGNGPRSCRPQRPRERRPAHPIVEAGLKESAREHADCGKRSWSLNSRSTRG
jgi:hypothetical protein